jgi:hypothetical protein
MLYYNNVYEVNVDDCVCMMVPYFFIKNKLGGVVDHCVICVCVCVCVQVSLMKKKQMELVAATNKTHSGRYLMGRQVL